MFSSHRNAAGTSNRGIFHLASALVLTGTLTGCVGAQFVQTSRVAYAPRPADCSIEVFRSALPEREYLEIGVVEGEGSHWKSDLQDVLPKLKEEACAAGGHALILGSENEYSTGHGEDRYPVLRSTATVIRWKG